MYLLGVGVPVAPDRAKQLYEQARVQGFNQHRTSEMLCDDSECCG